MSMRGIIGFLTALGFTAQFANGQLQPDCNPLHEDCPPKKALPEGNYYVDFTKQEGPPSDWTVGNSGVVDFTSNGAEFSYAKGGDAPNMWTNFYMLGGRYDVEMKIAPGQGVISSASLWSDTQDEIDFEFSGNQFGQTPFPPKNGMWALETNVFAQGKMWEGAAIYQKDSYKPAEQFHKYSVEWDEDNVKWYVDNKLVRSLHPKDTPKGFTFPQSPMKLQLGVWGGGYPSNNYRTIQWAGGEIDMKGAPYIMYVKSVNITNKYPTCQYSYKDKSGKQSSIEKIENGCNPDLKRIVKKDPAANDYPVSSPVPVASEAGSSTPVGYPTYAASSPSSNPVPTLPSSISINTYPTSLLSSSSDLPSSSPVEYPTYPASSPLASSQPTSSSAGYPTSEVDTSSIQSSSSVAASYSASLVGSSSVIVSSSTSSAAENFETYPASSVPSVSISSASASSASASSASVSSASNSSPSSVGVSSSSTTDGYPTQPLTESGTVYTQSSTLTTPEGYPVSSPTTGSGILSSLSSIFLGTSSSSSVLTQTDSSVIIGSSSTEVASSSVDAVSSSTPISSQESGSGYPVLSPSASSASVSSASVSFSSVTQPGTSSVASGSVVSYTASSQSASSSAIVGSSSTISTVYSSTIYTITSCAPSVTNCPVGQVTTESISVSTTVYPVSYPASYPVSQPDESQPITSSTVSDTSVETQPGSSATASSATTSSVASSSVISSFVVSSSVTISSVSEVFPTTESGVSYFTYPTSGGPLFSQTLPSTYSVSSEITTSALSTVYSTNVVTITSCVPSVTNCPVGQVTTETVSAYTTICPVTQTILDGITYGVVEGTDAASLPAPSTYPASSPSSKPAGSASLTSSGSLYLTSSSINSVTVSSPVLSSVSGYPTISSGISVGSSSSVVSSSIVFQNSTASTPKSVSESSIQSYSASSIPASGSETRMTTSTVYSTNIYTITSCEPGVTNCPAQLGQVTTDLISLYTTVCPVSELQTTVGVSSSVLPVATQTSTPGQAISSYATLRNSSTVGSIPSSSVSAPVQSSVIGDVPSYSMSTGSGLVVESSTNQAASSHATSAQSETESPSYTTSTVYSTNIYTVTSCAPGVTNCPASGAVTTEIVAVSTTVCPVSDSSEDTPGTTVPATESQYITTAITFSDTVSGSVIVVTTTISFIDTPAPTSYYPTQGVGTASTAGTDAIASSSPGIYPNMTKPGTTVTLGNYFTTVIEYDTITPQVPASVSSGATPTSYYTASQTSPDVPSYQMSEASSTVGATATSVPVVISPASSYLVASSQVVPGGDAPGQSSSYADDLTTVTASTTDTRTVFQTRSSEPSGTCVCEPSTVSVTVTQTVARITVTSTAEPFVATTYPMSTGPIGTGGTTASTYPTNTPVVRRWFRRGHGYGGAHGH